MLRWVKAAVLVLCLAMAALATAQQIPATPFVAYVPHILSGAFGNAGFSTKVTIIDLSGATNQITYNEIDVNGNLIKSTPATVPANGTVSFNSDSNRFGPVDTHWAAVGSTGLAAVNFFFDLVTQTGQVTNSVGFNNSVPAKTFTFPAEFKSGSHTVGLSVVDTSGAANTVTVQVIDGNGTAIGSTSFQLPKFGKITADLSNDANLKPVLIGDINGTIKVTSTGNVATATTGSDGGFFFSTGDVKPVAASGGSPILAATVTVPANSFFFSGSCDEQFGTSVPGATTDMTVAVSPSGDPSANSFVNVMWNGFVDSPNHVTLQFCQIGKAGAGPTTNPQVFNVRVFPQNATAGTTTVAVPQSIAGGTCRTAGAALPAADPSKTILLTPAADPHAPPYNLDGFFWVAGSDAAGHAIAKFCAIRSTIALTQALNFNVAVIN